MFNPEQNVGEEIPWYFPKKKFIKMPGTMCVITFGWKLAELPGTW